MKKEKKLNFLRHFRVWRRVFKYRGLFGLRVPDIDKRQTGRSFYTAFYLGIFK
jgi:hypothetical protein